MNLCLFIWKFGFFDFFDFYKKKQVETKRRSLNLAIASRITNLFIITV